MTMSRRPERLDDRRRDLPTARLLPHDLDAEESLLGAMLITGRAIEDAAPHIADGTAFYRPAHGHIYDAVCALYRNGNPRPDPVTVSAHLRSAGLLDHVGGPSALVALVTGCASTTAAGHYAAIVAAHHRRRTAIAALHDASEALYAEIDVDPTSVIEALDHATTTQQDDSWRDLELEELLVNLDNESERLGIMRVDGRRLIQCGVMNLFIGPPESGKSWAAILSAVSEIASGRPVMWIDLEQGPRKVIRDLIIAGLDKQQIADGLRYIPVDRPPRAGELHKLAQAFAADGGQLVVIDSIGEMIERLGFDPMKQARGAMHLVCDPLLAVGLTIVGIDHVVKDETSRGNYAHGDQGKTAKTTVTVGFDIVEPFGIGRLGHATLSVRKDRWGDMGDQIVIVGKQRRWGTFQIDSRNGFEAAVLLPTEPDQDDDSGESPTIRRERKKREDRRVLDHEEIKVLVDAAKAKNNELTITRAGMALGEKSRTTVQRRLDIMEEMNLVVKESRMSDDGKHPIAVWVLTDLGRNMRK
jgi:hypothetical protein